jgi:type IV pilus assembly protein PilQ
LRYQSFKNKLLYYIILCLLLSPLVVLGEDKKPPATNSLFETDALVTNAFFETDIREVLRDISAQTGVMIIPDETVQGSISIELKEVPLEEALHIILAIGNYTFRKMPEGYYLVGLCTSNSPSFSKLSISEYLRPNYLKAKELQSVISEFYRPYVQINEESNTVTITASPEITSRIKEDLVKFDQRPRQVMIGALVIELSEEGKKSLGVTWGSMLDGGFSIYPPSSLTYTLPGTGKSTYEVSGTASSDLLGRINTLIYEGKAKVRANPRIATLEGKQAEINIGREEFYLINVGAGSQTNAYTLQSVSTGVILKITPYVDKNNRITVAISPDVSEVVGKGATNLPVVTRRSATTSVRVDNGQTIAIGGLVQEQSSEVKSRVPILGAAPLIGMLFRHKKTAVENKEVVIFITPRVLEEGANLAEEEDKNSAVSKINKAEESPLKIYYQLISKIINEHKKFPDNLAKLRGFDRWQVTLEFNLSRDGKVNIVRVVRSSGAPALDRVASNLIESLSPFPRFPEEMKQPNITFVVTLKYEF